MSSTEDNLPFPRGTTALANCGTLTSTMADHLEGREYEVLDRDLSTSPGTIRSHRKVRLRVVRNASGVALPPKRLVVLARDAAGNISGATATAGIEGTTEVVGIQRFPNIKSYPVDEWLPAAGVPANDLFYIVIRGPAMVLTRNTDYSADIAVGDIIPGAATASTSAATNGLSTGGKADAPLSFANTDLTASHMLNVLGRALSTRLTTATNSNLLVEVGGFWD
jgi:hypothetical protein